MQHYFGAAKSPSGRQERDRICEQRSSKNNNKTPLLSLRLLLASSWLIANCLLQPASGAVVPNGPNDQLNELLEKQNNIGRQQQHHRQATNDLFEQPEVVDERKQQQQQQRELQAQKLVSQGVINGNHATYVEPPADFKPIIYDYEKQQHQKQRQQQQQDNGSAKIDNLSESSDSPNQLVASIGENSQQQQSQRQTGQQQTDPLMISSSGSSSEFAGSDANRQQQQQSYSSLPSLPADQFPLKPSIGRWSDWHDMSVEPDLASSDTQQAANFFYAPKQRAAVPQSAPFRIRQQPQFALSWAQVQPQFQPQQQRVELSGEQKLEQLAALAVGSGIERTVVGEQQQQPDRGIKSVESGETASPSSGAQAGQVEGSPRLALNWPPSSPSSILIKMQQQQPNELNQSNQLQAASQPTLGGWQLLAAGKSLQAFKGEQQQAIRKQQQQQQPQLQRRSKRRRKSKTNAEVRIQQLVAASQHQHQLHQQQLQQEQTKQVNGLAGSQQLDQQQQQGQVRQQQQQEMERWQTKDNQHQISADEVSNSTVRANGADSRRGQVSQRVPGKPAVFIKRFGFVGGLPVRSSDGQLGVLNNSTSRRIVKRRRVKTLLPVGLSSWFLGGIRDLDGRHWQLPAEVISRLAVNDIDFSPQPPKVLPPPAGSVVIVGHPEDAASWQQQQPSVVVPPQQANRVPISQLIPR